MRGKRLWSADSADDEKSTVDQPAAGTVEKIAGVDCLQVFIPVEKFENGAHVYLQLKFRADRPHEIGIATFAASDSKRLQNCIVTATMGNYARLRSLELASETVTAKKLWPEFDGNGFTPHEEFPLAELKRDDHGDVVVVAQPDETDPEHVSYAPGTRSGWHYHGDVARQYWKVPQPDSNLQACVNGRRVYWNSESPIPGGIAFENFEMISPFQPGQEFWFGVESMAGSQK